MSPFFNPGPNPYGAPKVYLAAVGELMDRSRRRSRRRSFGPRPSRPSAISARSRCRHWSAGWRIGRDTKDFPISFSGLVATGDTDEELADATRKVRGQIAFYGSTPAYRGVLELHGWGELQSELNALSKTGSGRRWAN